MYNRIHLPANRGITFEIVIILFVVAVSLEFNNGNKQLCYEAICYFHPSGNYMMGNWKSASDICNKNSATLPVIYNGNVQEKLADYMTSQNLSSIWLAGREIRTDVWMWLNGKPVNNQIQVQSSGNRSYAALTKEHNLSAEMQSANYHYICRYRDNTKCLAQAAIRNPTDGSDCIVIYINETLNFIEARGKCLENGGDLATFKDEHNKDVTIFKSEAARLRDKTKYWIGLSRFLWISNITEQKGRNDLDLSNICRYMNSGENKIWRQGVCSETRGILCQRDEIIDRGTTPVKMSITTDRSTDVSATITSTWSHRENQKNSTSGSVISNDFSQELLVTTIVGGTVGLVIIAVIVGFSLRKLCRQDAINKDFQQSDGNQTQEAEYKDVNEMTETSGLYAEITRTVSLHNDSHGNNTNECHGHNTEEPQTTIEYATLEFVSLKKEPITSNLHEYIKASTDPEKSVGQTETSQVNALDGNIYAEVL